MKLDTSMVIIPHFSLVSEVISNLSHFLGCYELCCYMTLSVFCNKAQKVQTFAKCHEI